MCFLKILSKNMKISNLLNRKLQNGHFCLDQLDLFSCIKLLKYFIVEGLALITNHPLKIIRQEKREREKRTTVAASFSLVLVSFCAFGSYLLFDNYYIQNEREKKITEWVCVKHIFCVVVDALFVYNTHAINNHSCSEALNKITKRNRARLWVRSTCGRTHKHTFVRLCERFVCGYWFA